MKKTPAKKKTAAKKKTPASKVTIQDALTTEASFDRAKMLAMLTPLARKMEEDEIRKIMSGTSTKSYKIKDLHSIRLFCSFRVRKKLPLFPFKDMRLSKNQFPPSY